MDLSGRVRLTTGREEKCAAKRPQKRRKFFDVPVGVRSKWLHGSIEVSNIWPCVRGAAKIDVNQMSSDPTYMGPLVFALLVGIGIWLWWFAFKDSGGKKR